MSGGLNVSSEEPSLRTAEDVRRFEQEKPLADRLPGDSVFDVFRTSADRFADKTALTMVMTGAPNEVTRRVSYSELFVRICRAANLFSSLGKDHPGVAYMLPSMPETHATLWGAETAGFAMPINFLLQPEHIAELLVAADVRILVALGPHPQLDIWQKALAVRERIPGLTLIRVGGEGDPSDILDFEEATSDQPGDGLVFGKPRRGDAVAAYFHTGGTTGLPKLVAHTHSGQLASALGGAALSGFTSTDIMTSTLPMFHVAGTIFGGLACFLSGVEVVVLSPVGLRNPDMVNAFWQLCEQHRVTVAGGVPTSIVAVLSTPTDGVDLSALRCGLTGAASMPPLLGEQWKRVTGTEMKEVYGMTEASGLVAINPFAGTGGDGSVGVPLPYTRVTVRQPGADGSLGKTCENEEVGVLTVRGPTVSPGYLDPDHNQGVFSDGELNTGDLGYIGEDGLIYMAGRSKDLIIRSGHNIDPLMIENAMTRHPSVAVAAAVGMPDVYAGELPVCYVALTPGCVVSDGELQGHAQKTIAERPAWPKHIWIVDEIPLTTVGKIYKPSLRRDATERLVRRVLVEELGLSPTRVSAGADGKRGTVVSVTVPAKQASQIPDVEKSLAGFLFASVVNSE